MDMFFGGCYQEQEQLYIHVLFWKIKETGSIGIKKVCKGRTFFAFRGAKIGIRYTFQKHF